MSLGDVVKARLLDIAPLTALVSDRVFELVLPQNVRQKAVRFQVFGEDRPQHFRGPVNQNANRVQIDAYVPIGPIDPLGDVKDIADAIRGDGLGELATGVWGWRGSYGSPETIRVFNVELVSDGDAVFESEERQWVRIRQDYRFHWRDMT